MEPSENIKRKNLSLLEKGLILHALICVSFALIYAVYTYHVHDDFGLKRDDTFDTFINAAMLSAFVSSGSIPPHFDYSSSFSRLLLICNVLLSSFTKVWLITSEG